MQLLKHLRLDRCVRKRQKTDEIRKKTPSPGINVSVLFCNLKINYSVCRLVETYLDYKKYIKSGPSLDFSLVSFISSVSLLSGSIWLYINKKLISCESDNKLDEGIFLSDGLTEMWSKVNILMTYNLTRLDLRHDDSSVFVLRLQFVSLLSSGCHCNALQN